MLEKSTNQKAGMEEYAQKIDFLRIFPKKFEMNASKRF